MIQIVTDSAVDLPSEWIDEYQIHIIPVSIHFEEKIYFQGVDLTNEGFYELVDSSGIIPKTSQPTPQAFIDFYRKIAAPNDAILSIHVTSKLSGTLNSAELAARELKGEYDIRPFDTLAGSAGQGYMCREARELANKGVPLPQIIEHLRLIREHIHTILTLDQLEYARMSGRVKALQAALASLLNVKPIIDLHDGVLTMGERVRTRRRALDKIVDQMASRMGDKPVNAAVVQARDPETGMELLEKVQNRLNCNELILTDLSIAIAANLGPGTVGIIAYPVVS